jgi:hypothetical protein
MVNFTRVRLQLGHPRGPNSSRRMCHSPDVSRSSFATRASPEDQTNLSWLPGFEPGTSVQWRSHSNQYDGCVMKIWEKKRNKFIRSKTLRTYDFWWFVPKYSAPSPSPSARELKPLLPPLHPSLNPHPPRVLSLWLNRVKDSTNPILPPYIHPTLKIPQSKAF